MNYIVCFYWQGDRWQEKEGHQPTDVAYQNHLKRSGIVTRDLASKYVNNLYEGICRFTKTPFKFVCFTNENLNLVQGIETRDFVTVTSKGVMPRMYMFSKEAGLFGSQVLSLDIDLIITGPLDDLLKYDGLFCTRKSFTRGEETLLDGDIMSFKACREIEKMFWDPLLGDIQRVEDISGGGRERFWVRHVMEGKQADTWQDLLPGQVVSYKHHVRNRGSPPEGTKIISCHGHPRPHQILDKWRTKYWK